MSEHERVHQNVTMNYLSDDRRVCHDDGSETKKSSFGDLNVRYDALTNFFTFPSCES